MKNKGWLWVFFAAFMGGCACLALCVGVIFISPYLEKMLDGRYIKAGLPAPDFTVPGLGGGQVRLSGYTGRPVLLSIGATWCPDCKEELPILQRLHEQYPELAVVLVNIGEPASVARPYYQRSMTTVTVALDEDNQVKRLYGVHSIPTLIFVDKQGIIRQVNIGTPSDQGFEEGLKAIGVH